MVRITNSARDKVTGSDSDSVVQGEERGLNFSLAGYCIDIMHLQLYPTHIEFTPHNGYYNLPHKPALGIHPFGHQKALLP